MRGAADAKDKGWRWRRLVEEPQVRLALVTAACLLVIAVVAKNVLEVELDFVSQLAPLWVYIAYLVSGVRERSSEIAFTITVLAVTAGVLVLYAI